MQWQNGSCIVFNKYAGAGYENMSEWKQQMYEELDRNISRPFIHAPSLAENVSVSGIPHVILVENGTIIAVRYGLWNNADSIAAWFISEMPSSGGSQEIEMEMEM